MSQPRSTSQSRLPLRNRSRSPISHPTTPLRPSSRSSFRNSQTTNGAGAGTGGGPSALDALESQFAELSDSMADLEANFMHLQLMHESLSRFGESFASFLYGLNMNAFVVDFPEAPLSDSIKRHQKQQQQQRDANDGSSTFPPSISSVGKGGDGETTFMTTADASFASMKATPRRKTLGGSAAASSGTASNTASKSSVAAARGGGTTTSTMTRGGRGASGRIARGSSGLPRGRGRGVVRGA